jgi:hypothetical protein
MEPDREVRCFQSVLLDLGARLGLPGMVNEDGRRSSRIMPTTSSTTSAGRVSGR